MDNSQDLVILHSAVSGKDTPEVRLSRLAGNVAAAFGLDRKKAEAMITCAASREEVAAIVKDMIARGVSRIAINGGDGFAAVFFNCFQKVKARLKREDYKPDILFLPGGTGNAVSFCSNFKNPVTALKSLFAREYRTEPMSLLEVADGEKTELAHFISFGADGEIISIYNSQKLKGFLGYVWAVLRYSFSRKLYNPFCRRDANFNLDIAQNGASIHKGRYEGGGISAIPFVGYGFRPYPLAKNGAGHIRFVLYGALLMPLVFKFTQIAFPNRPNRIIYDNVVAESCDLEFSFDKDQFVQVSGDLREKQSRVRVRYSTDNIVNVVKRSGS